MNRWSASNSPSHSQAALPAKPLSVDHLDHGGSQCHSRPAHGLHAEREPTANFQSALRLRDERVPRRERCEVDQHLPDPFGRRRDVDRTDEFLTHVASWLTLLVLTLG